MHDQVRHDMERAIDAMSDAEKLELIERVTRSLRQANGHRKPNPPERVAQRIKQIAALPVQSPPDGFSARNHDAVLYGTKRRPAT